MRHCIVWALIAWLAAPVAAQNISLSTNLLDWANLGTLNLQASCSLNRHLTLNAGARYNNWNFGSPEKGTAFQNRARTASVGMRYWPWNVYSSWWFGAKARMEEYNRGGLLRNQKTEEGVAGGVGLAAGYSRMLSRHWNLDVGIGFWTGVARYTQYRCPRCGRTLVFADGAPVRNVWKGFLLPSDDIQVGLTYVF